MPQYIHKGRKNYKFVCVVCKKESMGSKLQKYCSKLCKDKIYRRETAWGGLSTGTVGAIQELRVSVDLMSKGFELYRALSPASSCDILALKNNKTYLIEVRTAYMSIYGKITCPPGNIRAPYLALALPEKIIYRPPIN